MKIFGKHDQNTLDQFNDVVSRAVRAALMADGHFGYIQPVGAVTAYRNKVSIAGVGYDISCGNTAIKLDTTLTKLAGIHVSEIEKNPHRTIASVRLNDLARELYDNLSFGIGRKNKNARAPIDDPMFHDHAWFGITNNGGYRETLMDKARDQLGTIGGGNHYVDIFADEDDNVWVGVHFGSRGLGHTIASDFLALSSGGTWGDKVKEHEGLVDLSDPIGHDYWQLKNLAGKYARAGRRWVVEEVARMLKVDILDRVDNNHNDAWKEFHEVNGEVEELIVVRKGCTPAFPNQRGFVGGSMGDNAVVLKGANAKVLDEELGDSLSSDPEKAFPVNYTQKAALYSTVHGAGRVKGRQHAKRGQAVLEADGKTPKKDDGGNTIRTGAIDPKDMKKWLAEKGVIVMGGDVDESPQAYRRLPEVLEAQGKTIEVLHQLRPVIVCMAPSKLFDKYKD